MENENLNIKAIMESRRHTIEQSLRTIGVPELKALTDDLFLYIDDPWFEMFVNTIEDPTNHRFYHAIVDDRIQLLYCRDKAFLLQLRRAQCLHQRSQFLLDVLHISISLLQAGLRTFQITSEQALC